MHELGRSAGALGGRPDPEQPPAPRAPQPALPAHGSGVGVSGVEAGLAGEEVGRCRRD